MLIGWHSWVDLWLEIQHGKRQSGPLSLIWSDGLRLRAIISWRLNRYLWNKWQKWLGEGSVTLSRQVWYVCVLMSWHIGGCEFMYVYVCTCECIYVYGCELTIGMYMHMCVYMCVHIGAETYLCGYVECVCVCVCDLMYFVRALLSQPEYKWRWSSYYLKSCGDGWAMKQQVWVHRKS